MTPLGSRPTLKVRWSPGKASVASTKRSAPWREDARPSLAVRPLGPASFPLAASSVTQSLFGSPRSCADRLNPPSLGHLRLQSLSPDTESGLAGRGATLRRRVDGRGRRRGIETDVQPGRVGAVLWGRGPVVAPQIPCCGGIAHLDVARGGHPKRRPGVRPAGLRHRDSRLQLRGSGDAADPQPSSSEAPTTPSRPGTHSATTSPLWSRAHPIRATGRTPTRATARRRC